MRDRQHTFQTAIVGGGAVSFAGDGPTPSRSGRPTPIAAAGRLRVERSPTGRTALGWGRDGQRRALKSGDTETSRASRSTAARPTWSAEPSPRPAGRRSPAPPRCGSTGRAGQPFRGRSRTPAPSRSATPPCVDLDRHRAVTGTGSLTIGGVGGSVGATLKIGGTADGAGLAINAGSALAFTGGASRPHGELRLRERQLGLGDSFHPTAGVTGGVIDAAGRGRCRRSPARR